jgi:ABC-type branched-subunit amino acid transport system permease subunit
MARAMGVRSARVDALTFGLGSGIAGVAGVALSQLTNVGPNLGQAYIVDSFMVVVFGGVGNLWGTLIGGSGSASPTSSWSPGPARCSRRSWCWSSSSCSSRSARAACSRRRAGRRRAEAMLIARILKGDRGGQVFLLVLLAVLIAVPILNGLPADHPAHVSTFTVTLLGKYLTYALLAVAVDLVWGYLGILSLGHAAFFALGGYAMGMYLMRQIGERGVYGTRSCRTSWSS